MARKFATDADRHLNSIRNRRARIAAAGNVDRFKPIQVFERDDWKCGICGLEVDKSLKWPDPGSPSVDHIVSLLDGGDHSLANVQCAHLSCNTSKGAGMRGGYRPGAGRPPKEVKMTSAASEAEISWIETAGGKITPLEHCLFVLNDPAADVARRDRMAIAALQFCHTKVAVPADEHVGKKEQARLEAKLPDTGTALGELMARRQGLPN